METTTWMNKNEQNKRQYARTQQTNKLQINICLKGKRIHVNFTS